MIQVAHLVFLLIRSVVGEPHWRPLITDFDAFWSGAVLAIQGQPSAAYDPTLMSAMQAIGAQSVAGQFLPYMNPPIFLLLCLPLGLLPYLPAMAAFILATFIAAIACLKRILPPRWPMLPVAMLPVLILNATDGQNGAISATAFAAGMLHLERRPVLAGFCLGILSFKPHLALGVPIALGAARRWTTLVSFVASVGGLTMLSWVILGRAAWASFLGAMPVARHVLEQGTTWPKMQSVYAAARILHGNVSLSLTLQAVAAVLALVTLALHAKRRFGAGPEMSALVSATLLCTPYLLDYDLVCLAIPMAWIVARGSLAGWLPWEKSLLAVLYVYPLEARNLNVQLGIPVAPFLVAALFGTIVARTCRLGSERACYTGVHCIPHHCGQDACP